MIYRVTDVMKWVARKFCPNDQLSGLLPILGTALRRAIYINILGKNHSAGVEGSL